MEVFRRHRRLLIWTGCALACIGAIGAVWLAFGHRLIETAYVREQRTFLRNIIPDRDLQPLERYQVQADRLVGGFLLLALGVVALLLPGAFCDRWMARLYGAILGSCDWLLARRRMLIVVGGAVSVALLSWIAIAVLQTFPNSSDEYCYIYQALTWRAGRLWNPAHPLQPFFAFYHVRNLEGRVFSVFPIGWPFVLLVALVVHVPLWLVNPLLATLSLVVLFALTRRLFDERIALLTVATTFVSSFFLFNSASFFSHAWCLLLVLLFVHAALRAMDEDSVPQAVLAGLWFGAAFVTRYYSALLCAMPVAVLFLTRYRRRWRLLPAVAAGGLPLAIVFFWYNRALTGSPFRLPMSGFENYDALWFRATILTRGVEILGSNLANFVYWTPPAALFLFFASRRERRDYAEGGFGATLFWCLVVGYYFYVAVGGNEYGPRYYYEALPFVSMLAVWLVFREQRYEEKPPRARWQFYVFVLSVVVSVPLFAWHCAVERQVIRERTDLYRRVEQARITNALVFISTEVGARRPMPVLDLTRNGVDDGASVLYVHDLGAANRTLMAMYPDKIGYRYRYDKPRREGVLERLTGE